MKWSNMEIEKCCGSCYYFENEGVYGDGECSETGDIVSCDYDPCEKYKSSTPSED